MNEELYQGRPGFCWPYEGPTVPEVDKPDGWKEMTLEECLEYTMKAFSDEEVTLLPSAGVYE